MCTSIRNPQPSTTKLLSKKTSSHYWDIFEYDYVGIIFVIKR